MKKVVAFFTGRDHFTKVGDERSFTRIVTRSIVQRSVMVPTLFIIFIIDLQLIGHSNHTTNCDLQLIGHSNHMTNCADVCNLLVPVRSDVDICLEFQHILKFGGDNK